MQCITRYGKEKQKYKSEEEALEVADEMEEKYHEPFNVYQCELCNYWHVGRTNGHGKLENEVMQEGK